MSIQVIIKYKCCLSEKNDIETDDEDNTVQIVEPIPDTDKKKGPNVFNEDVIKNSNNTSFDSFKTTIVNNIN